MKLLASLLMAASLAAPVAIASAQTAAPAPAAAPAASAAAPAAAAAASAPAAAPAAAGKPAKPDLNAGSAKYAPVCAACHGADGNSSIAENPKLAGQHPDYLVKQLQEFKSGKRASPVMKAFADQLSDQDMKNIGFWLATQKPKAGAARDKDLVALGERIYRGGIGDRQVPACAGCHSPNGAGIPSQFPRVGGQQAQYTEAQLRAFRDGPRKNSLQMSQVAAKLNDREIKALADYIAGLR
jgi:cytochrome c553